jgi:hypothetical protein
LFYRAKKDGTMAELCLWRALGGNVKTDNRSQGLYYSAGSILGIIKRDEGGTSMACVGAGKAWATGGVEAWEMPVQFRLLGRMAAEVLTMGE